MFLPHATDAAPQDCSVQYSLDYGHPDTYITAVGNPATGEFIGTLQQLYMTIRCKFSGAPTTAAGIYNRTNPDVYSTGLTATYISPAPVLTTPALAARGLGFITYIGNNPITTHEFHLNYHRLLGNPEGGGYYSFSMYLPYRFVKINDDFAPGYAIPVSDFPFNLVVFSVTEGYFDNEWNHYLEQSTESTSHGVAIALPAITVAQRTCTTPYAADGIIRLPIIYPNDLPAIGSTVPEREFVLSMDCPTHLGRVGFYIEPVHGIVNEDKGVININPTSSAKGIGLQITTNKKSNTALKNIYNGNWPGVHAPIKFGPTNPYAWPDSYSPSPSLFWKRKSADLQECISDQSAESRHLPYRNG